MHHDLAHLAQVYLFLFENQHVSHCHIELRYFCVVFEFCPFVGESHLSDFEFFAEGVEDELLELVSSEASAQIDQVLLASDVDDFNFE